MVEHSPFIVASEEKAAATITHYDWDTMGLLHEETSARRNGP